MSKSAHMEHWRNMMLPVDGNDIQVWPGSTRVEKINELSFFTAEFDDTECYHLALQQAILERESDPRFGLKLFPGACGVKVHHVDQWDSAAANFLHQRALALFSEVSGVVNPVCDMSWANVYRKGDYCLPHSHCRSEASVVYQLTTGNQHESDPIGGCLSFADPRMKSCCAEEAGRVTSALLPDMSAGMMIIFPSQLMHYVNPYGGDAPRITLSWNISAQAIPGSANPELDAQRAML